MDDHTKTPDGTSAEPTPVKFGRFSAGTLSFVSPATGNKKLGDAATTYAAQTSCPTSCRFFDGGGCYAESGRLGVFHTAPLNAAARSVPHTALDVAIHEAGEIDTLAVVAGRPLRLHTVGDCASDEAARTVAAAAARYRARGGGPVWTYTHAWRDVARASWGDVSVLASVETAADVPLAWARGYAAAVVDESFVTDHRHQHQMPQADGTVVGLDVTPCVEQTRGRKCSDCQLCFDDTKLLQRGTTIGFSVHGAASTVRQATKALKTPDDPNRRLTSRELIPATIAAIEGEGLRVTDAEIARRINRANSSVTQMRKTLAREAGERGGATGRIARGQTTADKG